MHSAFCDDILNILYNPYIIYNKIKHRNIINIGNGREMNNTMNDTMNNIVNKGVVFLMLMFMALEKLGATDVILVITVAIAISCFMEYFSNANINCITFLAYSLLCLKYPEFSYFIPLIAYDLLLSRVQYVGIIAIVVLIKNLSYYGYGTIIILGIVAVIQYILKFNSFKWERVKRDFVVQRDNLKETSIKLSNKLSELRYRQDEEITMATLNERNRIAREIHDNVGHLLSSSIIQIGAIMSVTKDDDTKKSLNVVSKTLNDGMNSIRCSVHDLMDDSIDLYQQIKKIKNDFNFCNVDLDYEVNNSLDVQLKYGIISIVKEALSNVIKHTNASNVYIKIYEHPKLLQLIIYDNGNLNSKISYNGIGLEGIKRRVEELNGTVNFKTDRGFKIFICFNLDN